MSDDAGVERSFLERLRSDPDDESRVVYTDWLEERSGAGARGVEVPR
jgi:uncharacterized protein (TIGR02996 family)